MKAISIVLLIVAIAVKKKVPLIVLDAVLIVLLALVFILFPVIFGAGMKEILFTWAPWSLTGGLITLLVDILVVTVKLLMGRSNTNNDQTI